MSLNPTTAMVRSVSWSLAGHWAIRCLGVLKMVVLARLLSPQDFGVFGAMLIAVNCLAVLSETGVGAALIQLREAGRTDLDTAWTIAIARGALLCGLLIVASGPLSTWFGQPQLKTVFQAVSICFVLEGFANIGVWLFQRDIDFRSKAMLEVGADLAGSLSTILLALVLRDFWALVLASIIWRGVYLGLSFGLHSYRPRFHWNRGCACRLIGFGKHVFWISLATFVVTNGDGAVVGRLLGLELLGYYSVAYTIANLPVTGFCEAIGRVSFPLYSRMQDEPERVRASFQRMLSTVLMALLPVASGMALLAEDGIQIVLGAHWLPMTGALQVLCLLGVCRGINNVIAPMHLALGRPDVQSRNKAYELAVFLLLIYPLTALWGVVGAGLAVGAVYLSGLVLNLRSLTRLWTGAFGFIAMAARVPLAATAGEIAAVWLAGAVTSHWDPLPRLLLCAVAAIGTFFLIGFQLKHDAVMALCDRMFPALTSRGTVH